MTILFVKYCGQWDCKISTASPSVWGFVFICKTIFRDESSISGDQNRFFVTNFYDNCHKNRLVQIGLKTCRAGRKSIAYFAAMVRSILLEKKLNLFHSWSYHCECCSYFLDGVSLHVWLPSKYKPKRYTRFAIVAMILGWVRFGMF